MTRHHIRAQVRARRWRTLGRHVVVLHRGDLSPPQRQWAALLDCGPRSALCGLTAATLDGLSGFETSDIHVLVPSGVRATPLAGVIVHRSRRFDPSADVHPVRSPVRTRLPRSLVDAATWMADPVRACGLRRDRRELPHAGT